MRRVYGSAGTRTKKVMIILCQHLEYDQLVPD
jgi:hypothetical protein